MSADFIRLALLAAGVILIAGIYLWDRYRRIERRIESDEGSPEAAASSSRREPRLGADEAADAALRASRDDDLFEVPSLRLEPADPNYSLDLDFDAHGNGDYLHIDPDLLDELPRKIVQLTLMSGDPEGFRGPAIDEAAEAVGFQRGEMNIYHRHDARNEQMVLYSMASVVEPGSFPFAKLGDFSTPGLILFTQLPGYRDGLVIFSDMLFTAERLSVLLNAKLCDERRVKLTKQRVESIRDEILEHRRQIELARRRA